MLAFADMPDESLMDFIRAGNIRAYETLVTRHHQRFFSMTYRWVLHAQDAEDIVQDAFVKLWSGKARWKASKGARFTTWFYRILHNQAMDLMRGRKRYGGELSDDIASGEQSAESRLVDDQQQSQLHQALAELPDNQRIAVNLFYFEQLPQKQIAEAMGLGVKAVESLLTRAKASLKERMKT
jgi:RNA polymerase sigma-70 factor (ECF subfamily)